LEKEERGERIIRNWGLTEKEERDGGGEWVTLSHEKIAQ